MTELKSKRLTILQDSLAKKEAKFDNMLNNHFADVASANGQPLNDKRNGHVTLNRWDKQNDSLRNQKKEIEKTKLAIEKEENKIINVLVAKDELPEGVIKLIESGEIVQWRKHPNTFFVPGVNKARFCYDSKKGIFTMKYLSAVKDPEQHKLFKEAGKKLLATLPKPTN